MKNIYKQMLAVAFIIFTLLITDYYLGFKAWMYLMAAIFLVMALLFTYNNENCVKYFNVVNYSYMKRLEEKGEEFKKKNIMSSIIAYYVLAITTFINASIQRENKRIFTSDKLHFNIKYVGLIVAFVAIGLVLNNLILKKSKSNRQYVVGSLVVGALFAIVLIFYSIDIILM